MPQIHESVFLAKGSIVVKNVTIGEQSSVWFNTVIRGDDEGVRIGARTNVQDNVVIHSGHGYTVVIGDDVTIGHSAIVHGCKVGSSTLIGMGAIVMNGAVIGSHCIVAAGSLVTEGTVIPDGWVAMGRPAKPVRQVSEKQLGLIRENADRYVEMMEEYKEVEA